MQCGIEAGLSATGRVRLLLRPRGTARQLENVDAVVETLRTAAGVRFVDVGVADAARLNATATASEDAFLCAQARWYAGAAVVVAVHGSQNTNAIFADSRATVVDVQPFAYKPESAAPRDYYEAILANTDVRYVALASARPHARPRQKGDPAPQVAASSSTSSSTGDGMSGSDPEACRREKRCRLAFRDGGNVRLDDTGLHELRRITERAIAEHARTGEHANSRSAGR